MSPNRPLLLLGTLLALPLLAQAHPVSHTDYGHPASANQVTRTIRVEANDQMQLRFSPGKIHEGDVVRFIVHNSGKIPHEFSIGDAASQQQHRAEMRAMPDMQHDDPNVITLAPGQTKELVWAFSKLKQHHIVFACNIPGHAEAGMQHSQEIR